MGYIPRIVHNYKYPLFKFQFCGQYVLRVVARVGKWYTEFQNIYSVYGIMRISDLNHRQVLSRKFRLDDLLWTFETPLFWTRPAVVVGMSAFGSDEVLKIKALRLFEETKYVPYIENERRYLLFHCFAQLMISLAHAPLIAKIMLLWISLYTY